MGRFAKGVYYSIQKARCGVTPDMVEHAANLLERPWRQVIKYIRRRIESNYNADNNEQLQWLKRQPITSKDDYQHEELSSLVPLTRLTSESRRTSGSSGEPFYFRRSREMTAWMDAAMWAVYSWYSVEPGDKMARFWGRPVSGLGVITRKVADRLLRQRRMSAFDVSRDLSEAFFSSLIDWNPTFIYGYPTVIREFIEHVRKSGADGRTLDLNVVITTGEILDSSTRNAIEEFFACPVANEYGCSEGGILSFECRAGTSHLIPVAAYAEVLGEAGPDGQVRQGPVAITDLYGDAMSFVRYRLNDVGRWSPVSECQCGRELPSLEPIAARKGGFIRKSDGQKIYGAVLAYSVPHGVSQFQVRQAALDRLEGEIVVSEEGSEEDIAERCRSRWQDAVGHEMKIELEVVRRISPSESGKRQYFVPLDAQS